MNELNDLFTRWGIDLFSPLGSILPVFSVWGIDFLVPQDSFRRDRIPRDTGRQELCVPRTRLVSPEKAFAVAASTAWTRLPVDIKSTRDIMLSKIQLKTFIP